MYKQVYKLDAAGFYIETLTVEFDGNDQPVYELEDNVIVAPIPHGFVRAKWTGAKWVEGATQEEVEEATKSLPSPPSEMEIIKAELAKTNEDMLMVLELLILGGI